MRIMVRWMRMHQRLWSTSTTSSSSTSAANRRASLVFHAVNVRLSCASLGRSVCVCMCIFRARCNVRTILIRPLRRCTSDLYSRECILFSSCFFTHTQKIYKIDCLTYCERLVVTNMVGLYAQFVLHWNCLVFWKYTKYELVNSK